MLSVLAVLGIFTFGLMAIIAGIERGWLSAACGASSPLGALFLFDFQAIQAAYRILLYRVLIAVCVACGFYFFFTSNHFVLSLDIIFIFSTLMLIMHHNLKMTRVLPQS